MALGKNQPVVVRVVRVFEIVAESAAEEEAGKQVGGRERRGGVARAGARGRDQTVAAYGAGQLGQTVGNDGRWHGGGAAGEDAERYASIQRERHDDVVPHGARVGAFVVRLMQEMAGVRLAEAGEARPQVHREGGAEVPVFDEARVRDHGGAGDGLVRAGRERQDRAVETGGVGGGEKVFGRGRPALVAALEIDRQGTVGGLDLAVATLLGKHFARARIFHVQRVAFFAARRHACATPPTHGGWHGEGGRRAGGRMQNASPTRRRIVRFAPAISGAAAGCCAIIYCRKKAKERRREGGMIEAGGER